MYGKLFAQMYDGTLGTKGPWQALVTFQQLIIIADKDGIVDMTAEALSRRTTIPLEVIELGIAALLQPDKHSRSPDEDGKRIIPLDPSRPWGWKIVNYEKYRKLRSEDERREYHRQYWHKRKLNNSTETQQTQPIAVSSKQYVDVKEENTMSSPLRGKSPPPCPVEKITEEYHRLLPELPSIVVVNTARRAHVRARWREVCAEDGLDTEGGLEFFRDYFGKIRRSRFLMGKAPATNGRGPFKADFDWIFNPQNFLKIIEGKYDVQDKGKGT